MPWMGIEEAQSIGTLRAPLYAIYAGFHSQLGGLTTLW